MKIDCHVHISATTAGHGSMSDRLLNSAAFRFMRWRLGLVGNDASTERALEATLSATIRGSGMDAAVVLAFDGVHRNDGSFDREATHLYVTNDYVIELARRHEEMLLGASVHPYRPDAVAEIERCAAAGAVLCKWLPPTQGMDPADDRCTPFYDALARLQLPLLCHTGGEQSLPKVPNWQPLADPARLEGALRRGVTVILAHCGTRATPWETDYLKTFMRLAQQYQHCYGDTSALNLPTRWDGLEAVLEHPVVRNKLVHGSDWPIIAIPPFRAVGAGEAWDLMTEPNWMRRDVLIKEKLGFDRSYWERAGRVLRMDGKAG